MLKLNSISPLGMPWIDHCISLVSILMCSKISVNSKLIIFLLCFIDIADYLLFYIIIKSRQII